MPGWKIAGRTVGPVLLQHAHARSNAEGRDILAIQAVQLGLREGKATVHARQIRLKHLPLIAVRRRLPHDVLDLLAVLLRDVLAVLGLHQGAGVLIGFPNHLGALALDNHRGQDRHHVRRKLLDVLGHADQHDSGARVVPSLHQALHNHIGVQQHEPSPELLWQSQLLTLQVLVGSEQELVRLLVVAHLLLLLGNDMSSARCLHVVA
mmetsp:Transcript_26521/g.42945  ORF Transcript_26521/g.42945 Transcript_26521/m.42945 type:complete len:207 (-) Transcript_26521:50-670(-)